MCALTSFAWGSKNSDPNTAACSLISLFLPSPSLLPLAIYPLFSATINEPLFSRGRIPNRRSGTVARVSAILQVLWQKRSSWRVRRMVRRNIQRGPAKILPERGPSKCDILYTCLRPSATRRKLVWDAEWSLIRKHMVGNVPRDSASSWCAAIVQWGSRSALSTWLNKWSTWEKSGKSITRRETE